MLKQKLQSDVKESLKKRTHEVSGVLRMALAAVNNKEKEKRYVLAKKNVALAEEEISKQSALSDDEIISVLSFEVKKRRDAIALYEKGGRPELAQKEKSEIIMLQKYLPEQLPADELKKLIETSIKKVGASSVKDTGKIMADLMPNVKGKAEGSEISKIIKELLS